MDFSNIAAMYSDTYANAANQSAAKLQNKVSGTDYSKASNDELLDACKQFEAYFIEQMYKSMMKTVPSGEGMSGSTSSLLDYYKDQMIQSMAEQTTDQNSLGLAKMLYEQMRRNYGLTEASDNGAEAGTEGTEADSSAVSAL